MRSKKKNTKNRKKQTVRFRFLKLKLLCGLVLLSGAAGYAFWSTPTGVQARREATKLAEIMQEKAGLKLEQVDVEGRERTKIEDINAAMDVYQGMPIMDIDLDSQKEKIMELPWVRAVLIKRVLPNRLLVKLTEKIPVAIWQHQKKSFPIDENGETIADDKTLISNVLLVVGEDAPKHTPTLIAELNRYPTIAKRVRSAVRIGNRRWDLHLDDVEQGLLVCLPETEIGNALERLKDFQETGQILEREINVIDLKLPDRLIVRSDSTISNKKKDAHE